MLKVPSVCFVVFGTCSVTHPQVYPIPKVEKPLCCLLHLWGSDPQGSDLGNVSIKVRDPAPGDTASITVFEGQQRSGLDLM